MAIPKKGSRRIIVDGIEYRWTIRSKPTYSQGAFGDNLTAAVELLSNPGVVLSVTFPWIRCDSWIGNPEKPVTPKDIALCIRAALESGWQPDGQGPVFTYVHKEQT